MKQIYTTTLRLNLQHEDDSRAFEYLRRMDKKQYRSYSKAIVAAINEYFGRQERLAADPYLETREKEDAFLRRVTEVIEQSLRTTPVGVLQFARLYRKQQHRSRRTRGLLRRWTLQTAFDTAFVPVWYRCNAKQGQFCYYNSFHKNRDTKSAEI